jgi:hypothetical protein
VKDRIIVIIALLIFAIMTHPNRRGYQRPARRRPARQRPARQHPGRPRRFAALTGRRRRLTAAGTAV